MKVTYLKASLLRTLNLMRPAAARRFLALYFAAALVVVGFGGLFFTAMAGGFNYAGAQCTPNLSYSLPAAPDLTTATDGLTVLDVGDAYYDVFGSNRDEVATSLNTCAPRFNGIKTDAIYLAYTSYNMNWQYEAESDPSGMCRLENIKVGLNVSQIYPRYDTTSATALLAQKWDTFIAGTQEHENGHLQIDNDLATAMLAELRAISEPCTDIGSAATTVTSKYSNLYSSENHDHDIYTEYGSIQGAIW
jgi:predicted secreted Zn-dependent protease